MEVSFSIDLTGSTLAKQLIEEYCDVEDMQLKLLQAYNRILLNTELFLYNRFLQIDGMLEKLFLVKSLGDELWYTIDIDPLTESKYLSKIIHTLLELISGIERLYITSSDISLDDNTPDLKKTACLGYKVTIDTLNHSNDFSSDRLDFMVKNLFPKLKSHSVPEIDNGDISDFNKISLNLNIGYRFKSDNSSHLYAVKSDPIGTSVDRFFRLTQFSYPGLILIGNDLLNHFNMTLSNSGSIQLPIKEITHIKYNHFPVIQKVINKEKMKGILRDYSVSYIPALVRDGLFNKLERCDTGDLFQKTREFLIENNFIESDYKRNLNHWVLPI